MRVFQQTWTQKLFERTGSIIEEDGSRAEAKATRRWAIRGLLISAEKGQFTNARQITPAWLADFPQQVRNARHERRHRTIFGQLLVQLGIWSQDDHKLFRENLAGSSATPNWGSFLRAALRRVLQQTWTRTLFERMGSIITENASSVQARRNRRCGVRRILSRAETELTGILQIKPAWLAGFPQQTKNWRNERTDRARFGQLLVQLGLWSEDDHRLLQKNLGVTPQSPSTARRLALPLPRKSASSPPGELCQLVSELAYHGGLALREIQRLRVTDIQLDGLQIRPAPSHRIPGRLIPFGSGPHAVSKHLVDAYVAVETPVDQLFFRRSSRDKRKSISRQTLTAAVAKLHPGSTIDSLRDQHFQEDFDHARSPQEARDHLRNVHGLSNVYVHAMIAGCKRSMNQAQTKGAGRSAKKHYRDIEGFVNAAESIPIPIPYLLAAMCASRSVSESGARVTIPEGGERQLITWDDVAGYEIAVNWKRSFATELSSRGQRNVRALRLLFRLAFEFWYDGRRMQLSHITKSALRREDREILDRFATTIVSVRDRVNQQTSWSGSLFEYGSRKRAFRIPLIEDLNRRAWHSRCLVCWHPERDKIESEVPKATAQKRLNGFAPLANKYGISSISLRRHCGRVGSVPGRGETQRSHFSIGPTAPIVRVPRRFFERLQELPGTASMIYSLLLLEKNRSGLPRLIVSPQYIARRLPLRLDDPTLSVALNHLGPTRTRLINVEREPATGFCVELLDHERNFIS
ncbi:MAG: hypothetical protein ACRD23_08955 [Terriglobales bacterium]